MSKLEQKLREKFGLTQPPRLSPELRIRQLGAFWHHWALHRRSCSATAKNIISPFSDRCPYPVMHKDTWLERADPPGADFQEGKPVFPQLWDFFQRSAIPHNTGTHNENCEYTDDWWHSKNCYLCHSGIHCEDLQRSYRAYYCKNSQYLTFSFYCELCADLVNCHRCFNVVHSLNCRNCHDSAFLYDCRNCSNCLFCSNLRNKQYCIQNRQLSKEEFEQVKARLNLASRRVYDESREKFSEMLRTQAYHRALDIDKCQNANGNFLENVKNSDNCFFIQDCEDCFNCVRGGPDMRDALDVIGFAIDTELILSTTMAVDNCYDIRFCFQIIQSRFLEYSAFCARCEHCFGCCGLVGKKYHIFNKPYSEDEYFALKEKIIEQMKSTGEYGEFFPGHFAPIPYEETWSAFYHPLNADQQKELGFRLQENVERRGDNFLSAEDVPDSPFEVPEDLTQRVFWDDVAKHPIRIGDEEINFAKEMNTPLPNEFYTTRLKRNFKRVFFEGSLRTTQCGKCKTDTETTTPAEYDGRILCEQCYLDTLN